MTDLSPHSLEQALAYIQAIGELQTAYERIERLRTVLSGISSCCTCEACRNVALKALEEDV